jgi:hypothetical protein
MKNMKLHTVLSVVLLLGLAGSANAQQNHSGFYVGVKYGKSRIETPTTSDRPGTSVMGYNQGSQAMALFGGYQKSIGNGVYLGGEAGYCDNGYSTLTYSTGNRYKFISTQYNLLGALSLRTSGGLFFYLKGGFGRVREQYRLNRYSTGTPDINSEMTKTIPVAAVGLGYALANGLDFFIDFQRTFGDRSNTVKKALKITNPNPPPEYNVLNSVAQVQTLTFGLSFRF